MRAATFCSTILAASLLLAGFNAAQAEPTAEVREQAKRTQALLDQLNQQITARRFPEALKQYAAARAAAEQCIQQADAKDAATVLLTGPLRRRLADLHGSLELEGFELEPLGTNLKPPAEAPRKPPVSKPAPSGTATPAKPLPTPPGKPATDSVSFRSQVAPLLVSHCVRCHTGAKPKGQFSLATFAALMNGVDGSAVIDPGRSGQSRLIEIIASGEMPKGKQKVSAADLAILSSWIDQGARFDGDNREEQLTKLATGTSPPSNPVPPSATPEKPAGPSPAPPPGAIAFSTHVAPVLLANCVGCHGGRQPRNRLSVESFAQLVRGGMSGKAITPSNGAGSLLVQKLKGTAKDGQRMPLESDPLSAAQISAIEQWIAAGAKFDGPDPARPLAEVVALGAARGATHDELSRQRSVLAAKNWKLAIPDDAARTTTTDNFLVIGNVSQQRLEALAAEAEKLVGPIRTALSLPADKPLVHGRLTIYAMAHRYDYTEFALMVERRSRLPRGQRGHWQYTVVDAYAPIIVPAESKDPASADTLAPLLTEQIAAATIATRWQVPAWLATGLGRAIAASGAPKDAPPTDYDERLKSLLENKPTADDWLTGKLPPDDADLLGYGLARYLLTTGLKMRTLATSLERGQPLDAALTKSHGRTLAEMAAQWLATPPPKPPRRK